MTIRPAIIQPVLKRRLIRDDSDNIPVEYPNTKLFTVELVAKIIQIFLKELFLNSVIHVHEQRLDV